MASWKIFLFSCHSWPEGSQKVTPPLFISNLTGCVPKQFATFTLYSSIPFLKNTQTCNFIDRREGNFLQNRHHCNLRHNIIKFNLNSAFYFFNKRIIYYSPRFCHSAYLNLLFKQF